MLKKLLTPREPTCRVVDEKGWDYEWPSKGTAYVMVTTPFVWQTPKRFPLDEDDVANIICRSLWNEYASCCRNNRAWGKGPECKIIETASFKLSNMNGKISYNEAMYIVYQKKAEEEELRSLNFRPF